MGTNKKFIYEAPSIQLKQVMMESDIMAASGDKVIQEESTHADIDRQGGFNDEAINITSWD